MTNDDDNLIIFPAELNVLAPFLGFDLIRIGNMADGGYVIPSAVLAITKTLVSMGINDDWSFDSDFLSRNQDIDIHAYDHSISSYKFAVKLVNSLRRIRPRRSSLRKILKDINVLYSYRQFFRGKVVHFMEKISNRVDCSTDVVLDTVFGRVSGNVFLKIDIEGAEYEIISDILKNSDLIVGMVIEFHQTEHLRPLFIKSINDLLSEYVIVHLHANNIAPVSADGVPDVLEITFTKKKQWNSKERRTDFPVGGLDYPNNPRRPDYKYRINCP